MSNVQGGYKDSRRSSPRAREPSNERVSPLYSPTSDNGETEPLLSTSADDNLAMVLSPRPQNYAAINKPVADHRGTRDTREVDIPVSWWWRFSGGARGCHWYWRDRIPKGKASALIFFLNVVESFAFYGATAGVLKLILRDQATTNVGYLATILLEYCVGRLFYPIMGVIADAYIGRHRMIHISLWLFWVAYGLLAFALSLRNIASTLMIHYVIPITAFVLLSIGAAGFEVNIIPFGMDQLQGASSTEMSSYFYWYYFGRQLGVLCGLLVAFGLFVPSYAPFGSMEDTVDTHSLQALQPLFVLALLTVALVMYYCLQGWLFKDRERENPLKLVVRVIWYAATARRQFPKYRRAFRYGEELKPRIDLAKIDYDGIFPSEDVEDVKTFCRIILVIFSLSGYFMSYSAGFVMFSYQVSSTLSNISDTKSHLQLYLFPNIYSCYDDFTIILFVLILNYLVIPYLPHSLNMKKRIGFGMVLQATALLLAALLEGVTRTDSPEHRLLYMLVPGLLVAFAEMLVFITGLEFIYAQSPESMKGLLTGLFYCTFGLSSAGGTLVYFFFTKKHCCSDDNVYATIQDVKGINFVLWYYVIFAVIAILGIVMFSIVASLYTNRQRTRAPPFEDDDWDRSHVHRVFAVRSP